MTGWRNGARRLAVVAMLISSRSAVLAHSGPPFPIVTDRVVGPYKISVWTDPDATDDGSAAGQFWVTIDAAAGSAALPPETRATVSVTPRDRPGPELVARTEPVRGQTARQFTALVMDHEGRFSVRVAIEGPLGPAIVDADVDATYELRPSPIMLGVYLVPFLLAGFLWLKLLLRRRRTAG